MAVEMYMGQPLHGDAPTIAVDLFDKSLKNLAPSYLTHLLNQKIMGGYDAKSGIFTVNGDTITWNGDDGSKDIAKIKNGNVYEVKSYASDGRLMQSVEIHVDLATGQIQQIVSIDGSVNGIKPFAEATMDEIAVMLSRHYAGVIDISDFWNVGDTKTILYNAVPAGNGVGETHPAMYQKITIIDFKKDILTSGGRAAVTLQFSNAIGNAGFIYPSASNVGGWRDSVRRAWCNDTFFKALDGDLQKLIKNVDKRCAAGNKSQNIVVVSDKIFLPSESELKGSNVQYSTASEGEQYAFYMNAANLKKKQTDVVSGYDNYWTRSPNKNNATQYVFVEADGDINVSNANAEYRLLPTFCI